MPDHLERVRAASGPDRELDAEIALALCGWKIWRSKHGYLTETMTGTAYFGRDTIPGSSR